MTKPRPVLLLTRPEGSAQQFLAQLDQTVLASVDVVISPLLRIMPTNDYLALDGYAGLIFTSANGVRAAAGATPNRDQLAYCVGRATTRAARDAGWTARQMGRTADELIAALLREKPKGPLMHLRGQHARGFVAQRLSAVGLQTSQQVIYRQEAQPLSQEAVTALEADRPIIVPLFSPRTARLFADQAPARPVVIAAFSKAVADCAAKLAQAQVHVAQAPDAQTMGQLVENLLRASVSG